MKPGRVSRVEDISDIQSYSDRDTNVNVNVQQNFPCEYCGKLCKNRRDLNYPISVHWCKSNLFNPTYKHIVNAVKSKISRAQIPRHIHSSEKLTVWSRFVSLYMWININNKILLVVIFSHQKYSNCPGSSNRIHNLTYHIQILTPNYYKRLTLRSREGKNSLLITL